MRIALYHCCPVSCSKRSVATYLLPRDTSLCDHLFIRWNKNVKLNVEDKIFSALSPDLQIKSTENFLMSVFCFNLFSLFFFLNYSMLLWTCMVFHSCCILSLLSFLLCSLYFQMQNLKDYFGYVHACQMFRMLISTKSCWEKKTCLLLKNQISDLLLY